LHFWKVLPESSQNIGEAGGQGGDAKTYPQQSGLPVYSQTSHLFCNLSLSQQFPRSISQDFSCRRKSYPPIPAYQQGTSHLVFQALYLFGERWLTQMQCFCCLTEVKPVCEQYEGTQFSQFECNSYRLSN
jgi:hypothetical protein